LIKENTEKITEALKLDLNKNEFDAYMTEIVLLLEEIKFAKRNIKRWSKPKKVKSGLLSLGSKGIIYPEPYGVTLIISPWNYPFQLAIAPLIGSIAAGNCSVIKPSELTPRTSVLIKELIERYFQKEFILVVEGGVEETTRLLNEKFDYIFFTGSVSVGKVIMEAASKNLTPLTLELGGKSPCIVDLKSNLDLAAKRIAWGKFLNAGQTCIAPDYLYVHEKVKEEFLQRLKEETEKVHAQYESTRIVNERHYERLEKFLSNGKKLSGGKKDKERKWIQPTILDEISWDDEVMKEEIFGPILPVLSYRKMEEAIGEIQKRPKPLALYLFSEDREVEEKVLRGLSFGGGCVNDTIMHLSSPYLPFGGVGESGMGSYHGEKSFDIFSHKKSILKQSTLFDLPFRYPGDERKLYWIKKLYQ